MHPIPGRLCEVTACTRKCALVLLKHPTTETRNTSPAECTRKAADRLRHVIRT